jgi:hypothetical protein
MLQVIALVHAVVVIVSASSTAAVEEARPRMQQLQLKTASVKDKVCGCGGA